MNPDGTRIDRLRERLVAAAMGALPLVACSDPQVPSASNATSTTTDLATAVDTPARPVPGLPSASAASAASSAPVASPTVAKSARLPPSTPLPVTSSSAIQEPAEVPRLPPTNCFNPFSIMSSMGKGGPGPKPPDTAYDRNGCLPASQVSDNCCNIASAGPRFQGGFCCYTITLETCCGRPFTVNGAARVAATRSSSDWIAGSLAHGHVDEAASHEWLRDAHMEHASVASFARFVLDLLSLGAPAALVRDALIALGDEIAHARLCFALASRFAGEPLGPGALSVDSASPSPRTIEDIVRDAVLEGCVGETVAAAVASERLSRSTDPEATAALERIAPDEARHAELAWRFAAWVVEKDPRAAAWIEDALASDHSSINEASNILLASSRHFLPSVGSLKFL